MQKMKKILLGNYPYRRITALLLLLSVVVLCFVFQNGEPESDVIIGSTGQAESVAENEADGDGKYLTDTEETEMFLVDEKVEESLNIEEIVLKEAEGSNALDLDVVASEESSVPDSTSVPEVLTEPESIEAPKKESGEQFQETIIPDVTPESENVTTPEPTPIPEEAPTSKTEPIPGETPTLESTPKPEETSVPHEHSWIFESWYQEPTCSNGGLVIEICVHCGETRIIGGTPTGEHSFRVETQGDCCSEELVVCVECNYREVREKDPGNHIDEEEGFCYGCGQKTQ